VLLFALKTLLKSPLFQLSCVKNACILVCNTGSGQWLILPSSAVIGNFCDEILDGDFCYEFSSDCGGNFVLFCCLLLLHGEYFL
jgi:hypothetical protein